MLKHGVLALVLSAAFPGYAFAKTPVDLDCSLDLQIETAVELMTAPEAPLPQRVDAALPSIAPASPVIPVVLDQAIGE